MVSTNANIPIFSSVKGRREETLWLWLEAAPLVSEGFSLSWHSLAADSLARGVYEVVRRGGEVVGKDITQFVTLVTSDCSLCISSCSCACSSLCWESRSCSCSARSCSAYEGGGGGGGIGVYTCVCVRVWKGKEER